MLWSKTKSSVIRIVPGQYLGKPSLDWQQTFDYSSVCRTDWIQQDFHLWANYAEKHRTFPLPIHASTEFCPIHIQDVCASVASLLLVSNQGSDLVSVVDELNDRHAGQVYTLTGPQVVNGKNILRSLIKATHYTDFQFAQIRPRDLRHYLHSLQIDLSFDTRLKKDGVRIRNDDLQSDTYRYNIIKAPTRSGKSRRVELPEGGGGVVY